MTDANPPDSLLDYSAAAPRRRMGLMTLALAAILVGVAGTTVPAISMTNVVVEWRTEEALVPQSVWQNRAWFAGELVSLLSSMMMMLGGIALLRRSPFLWNAAVSYTLLSLIASLMLLATALVSLVTNPIDLQDARAPYALASVTTPAGWAVFEAFLLLLLTRNPVRALIQSVATDDGRGQP